MRQYTCISLSWSNELKMEKIQETFYSGLNNTTKIEMVKFGIYNHYDIYSKINTVEGKLCDLASANEIHKKFYNDNLESKPKTEQKTSKTNKRYRIK